MCDVQIYQVWYIFGKPWARVYQKLRSRVSNSKLSKADKITLIFWGRLGFTKIHKTPQIDWNFTSVLYYNNLQYGHCRVSMYLMCSDCQVVVKCAMYKCITNDFKSMYYTCTLYMYYTLMLLAICCQQIGGYMSVANVNCPLYIGSWIYHQGDICQLRM